MENQILYETDGENIILQLLPDRIRIQRGGWMSLLYGSHKETDLPLEHIRSIELRVGEGGLAGYLVFHDVEGREAFEDYCVSFSSLETSDFERFKTAAETRLTSLRARGAV